MQADQITLIRDYFKDDALFDALCAFCQRQFDAKSLLSILNKVEAEYGQFYTNIAKYVSNPAVYAKAMGNSGAPRAPKPKKLQSVIQASLMLDGETTAFKTIHRKNDDGTVDNIEMATEHSAFGEQLKQHRTHLTERRTRYFESEFNKLSRRLVEYLLAAGVTDFVMSKNVSFLKTSDAQTNTLRSSTKQSFYHLVLGRCINLIAQKCETVGMTVHFINEAYTSKTSCLFANVNDIAELARTKKQSLSTTDCLGFTKVICA